MDIGSNLKCHENCFFQSIIGKGDLSGVTVYAEHKVAIKARELRRIANGNLLPNKIQKSKIGLSN